MLDGIEVEVRGKAAAVVCTEPFIVTGKAMARARGRGDYPFAVIPHPIASASDAELRARAEAALPQVVQLLVGQTDGAGPEPAGGERGNRGQGCEAPMPDSPRRVHVVATSVAG